MDASGMLEWNYMIPPDQAAALAKRCRLSNGQVRRFTDVNSPYFDEYLKMCIVARVYDEEAGEDATAEISGYHLKIRLFYTDHD